MSESLRPWIDLTAHGVRLSIIDLPSGARWLFLQNGDRVEASARRLGFVKLERGGQWIRDDLRFRVGDFRREFPQLRVVRLSEKEIVRQARVAARQQELPDGPKEEAAAGRRGETDLVGRGPPATQAVVGRPRGLMGARSAPRADGATRIGIPLDVVLMQAKYLGINYEGDEVWEDAAQRFIRRPGEAVLAAETKGAAPALFLRAVTEDDLDGCADAVALEISRERRINLTDLRRYASAAFGEAIGTSDLRLRRFQEAVEAALVRKLAELSLPDRETFEEGQSLYAGQPIMSARTSTSVMLQQFSTPLPLGVVAQRLLMAWTEVKGKTVLEPTIGHGALVSMLRGCRIVGFDLDADRASRARKLMSDGAGEVAVFPGDATTVDLPAADFVITNPPFGQLPAPITMSGLKVRRLDHMILMRALEARSAEGRAVAIIGGDNALDSRAGQITGSSRYLFNWLADHYEVEGVVELDARLYGRQGAGFPVRLVVIGQKRLTPIPGAGASEIQSPLPVVSSYDALWSWSESILLRRRMAVSAADARVVAGAAAVVGVESGLVEHRPAASNDWQVPYQPFSRSGEASTMIPRNLVEPTRIALQRIVDQHGDVDRWVADELAWTPAELQHRLSAEQVDAVALEFYAADRGRGLIEADQTGMGKGRVLACSIVRANRRGIPTVFLTEKANLLSDLWRDLRDIGEAKLFKPLVINNGVAVRDTITGEVLLPAAAPAEVAAALRLDDFPPGVNLVMATYSQFMRVGAKAEWLKRVVAGKKLVTDESHVAAGASRIAETVAGAVGGAAENTYSSATYAKGATNMGAYARAFPGDMDVGNLPDILAAGGEPLQEVLSSMLAEDGVLVRREHDLSQLTFRPVVDEARQERNSRLSDALAPILAAMAYMGGDIKKMVGELNAANRKAVEGLSEGERKGARMGLSSMEFGSRLYSLNRLFMLAIKVDLAVEEAVQALRRGEKPIIVVENTMEALLKDVMAEQGLAGDLGATIEVDLQYRDLLSRTLGRLAVITEANGYGEVVHRRLTGERWDEANDSISRLISAFPDLPISPLDSIRERIEAEGYRCEELSGRGLTVVGGQVEARSGEDRNIIIARFNSGESDAIIISRSGSTGISLHASPRFGDQRQRNLIEAQIANNVAERMQFWGRANRKDQVCAPIITTLASGLPGEARLLAMQNAKLRKLSANTTSNRSNAAEDESVPDILNELGDLVCGRLLSARPDLAERLMLDAPDEDDVVREAGSLYSVNKLLGRVILLPVVEQEAIYEEIVGEYRAVLEDFEARGISPFRTRELDGAWRIVERKIFEGAEGGDSAFSRPVYLVKLQGDREAHPLRGPAVAKLIENGTKLLDDRSMIGVAGFGAMERAVDHIRKRKTELLELVLPKAFETVNEALEAEGENGVKARATQIEALLDRLEKLRVGGFIKVSDEDGEARGGVVARIDPPAAALLHLPGKWDVFFLLPGDEKPRKMTMAALLKDKELVLSPDTASLRGFEEVEGGIVTTTRMALMGNLFRAVGYAGEVKADGKERLGSAAVWRDQDGIAHRAVLMPKNFYGVDRLPVAMPARQAAAFVRDHAGAWLFQRPDLSYDGLGVTSDGDTIELSVPGTVSGGGQFFADKDVLALTGDWAGNRARMRVSVPVEMAEDVMLALGRAGATFYAEAKHRDWAVGWSAAQVAAVQPVSLAAGRPAAPDDGEEIGRGEAEPANDAILPRRRGNR
jgi:predicted RNA methylase